MFIGVNVVSEVALVSGMLVHIYDEPIFTDFADLLGVKFDKLTHPDLLM